MDESRAAVPAPRPSPGPFGDGALYRALVEAFPDVTVFVFTPDLRYASVTGAAVTRIGWRPDELVGRRPSEILPGDDGRQLEQHLQAALTGETRVYEHAGVRDADAVWASTVAPVRDDDGQIVGGIVVSRNVGDIRRAERSVQQSEQRFAVALEAAPVLVFSQDRELRFTWANKTIVNPSPEAILGKTDDDVLPAATADITRAAKRAVIDSGEGRRLLFEVAMEGGPRFFDMTLEPTRDADGRVDGLVGAALDVTALRSSEQRLQAALEAMLDSVTIQRPVRDDAGEIVDFLITFATSNARDFARRGRDEIVGHTLHELYPALGPEFIGAYVGVLTTGEPLHAVAFPYVDDNGVTSLYDLAVSRVGEGLLVVWRDVTEREHERAAAAQAEAVRASSEQLQRGLLPPPPPDVAGLRFAASYRPATETAEVGGDWYDAVTVSERGSSVDVVVGDVEGHDGEAAALMARLSSVLRADSRRGVDVDRMIRELDVFHSGLRTERLASVAIARIAADTGDVVLVSAGHPAPLLVRADGATDIVSVPVAPPIGAGGPPPTPTRVHLEVGDTLLLFSDGLLDPHLDPDDAVVEIIADVRRLGTHDLQHLTEELARRTRAYDPSDDVVVMAARRAPTT